MVSHRSGLSGLPALFLMLALAGCARQAAHETRVPVAYYISEDPSTLREEREYVTRGGARLAYVDHRPAAGPSRRLVIYLHGIESHAGWFERSADLLCHAGFEISCLDRRGSGLNRENRGFPSGHVDDFEILLDDIDDFIAPLRARYDRIYLIGNSWGGKPALAYAIRHPENVDGVALITPGLKAKVAPGPLTALGILVCSVISPRTLFHTPIRPEMFTTRPAYLNLIRSDELRLDSASAEFFVESLRLDRFLKRHLPENTRPLLLFLAGADRIIDNSGVIRTLAAGGQPSLEIRTYAGEDHSLLFNTPERLVRDFSDWVERLEHPGPER